jgi:FMN phosphatase YigB (HAD superfamily)
MECCSALVNQELVAYIFEVGLENCYIVTNGDQEFQHEKIARAGLANNFKEIFVVSGTKKEKIKELCERFPDEEVIFIDNNSAFFNDIDMEACRNLKTVLYHENGFENVKAEVLETRKEENKRTGKSEGTLPKIKF